ncbi:hypothetical protein H8A99_32700 [Bradyrhizobium sp. Arg68]|uniref:TrbI/VirB10 family protein n=1 Tax=Bradyrhizobium ivorense TaxID=2511166 RepID=UPI001E46A180|nr:TrbI/VirB10 family protein [Bradyrhizobium ivorense]MCC8941065.1 hypothetical protein [Bradyrhizobium ivorense]
MRDIDDKFEVKPGRIGNRKPARATSYLRRVRQAAVKAGTGARTGSSFSGGRIGRGHAQGAVLAGRGRSQGQRRVVIKARIVRIKSGDTGAVRAHLRYVQRDDITREGEPGELYDASSDNADGKTFTERSAGDRHQFRFIVAPEDSAELADLKPFVRDLMQQMEQDLGIKLDWVAADHFNTGHPHTHIVLRGKDGEGGDLVIARDYIAHGLRSRAAEFITRELGPETEIEAARKLQQEITAERLTRLERSILRDAPSGALELGALSGREPAWQAARMGRLRALERMGLVEESEPGRWRIDLELEPKTHGLGDPDRGGTRLSIGNDENDLVKALRESTQQTTNRAGQRLVERELDVQPTITVRPGWPLRVIVSKDLMLKPYQEVQTAAKGR